MPLNLALKTVDDALRAGLAVNWYAGDAWLVSHVDDQIRREARVVGCEPVVSDLAAQAEGPDKLLVIAPPGDSRVLASVSGALPLGLHAQTSNPTYLEITRNDVDKASALRELCRRHGVDPGDVAAIGDGMNDLAMLAFAGIAVAPANARPAVIESADLVVASNDEDGVARALEVLASNPG